MIAIAVCLLVMLVLELLTPYWWWVMIVPFAFGVAAGSGWKALRTGFLAAGLLWLGASAYLFMTGSRIIAARMAAMFGLGESWVMVLATGLVAGLAAAFSGYAGYVVRALFKGTSRKGAAS
jgi:hypothetical protein